MKRRAFLGFLGGAAVAGQMGISDLAVPVSSLSAGGLQDASAGLSPTDNKSWARTQLSRLLGKSAAQIAREKRDLHVYAFDPDIAALRSMSLATKIRRQRRVSYELHRQREEENYRGVLAGLWD